MYQNNRAGGSQGNAQGQQGGYQQGGYQQGGYGDYGGGYGGGYGGYPPQGYGAPPYGAPPPGYGAPPPGYGGYGYGGYGQVMHPQSYTRCQYTYNTAYNAHQAYVCPVGVSPMIAQKMMTASNAFRYFDKDQTGTLNQTEWAQCMSYLGINIPQSEMNRLYYMIDSDRSGTINEREFCEWFSSCY